MAFQWIGKSSDGKTVTLKRLELDHFRFPAYFNPEWEATNVDHVRVGAILDVETTGLNHESAKVIEIGIRSFKFNRNTGEILALLEPYSAFQDPGQPLSEEVKALTGLTDEMLKGQSINWTQVDEMLSRSQIIVAHNASFDRPFIDRVSTISTQKIWGCSFKQVDWDAKGYTSQKLDVLSIYHGFFTDAHRALNDSDALLHLLSFQDSSTGKPYFQELLTEARKTTIQMVASNSPFESKDHLKNRNYRWDPNAKSWSKEIEKHELTAELEWLEEFVYHSAFRGKHHEVSAVDHFKAKS